jgi:tRNA G10  N-methylase Trm11
LDSPVFLENKFEESSPRKIDFSKTYHRDFKNSAHNIHKYTARMIPPISRYLIEKYSRKGELVFDPFCGSGTTLLEAYLLRRRSVGIDLNPLATLISRVKTTPLNEHELKNATELLVAQLREDGPKATVDFPNIDYWFCEKAKEELQKIRFCVDNLRGKVNGNIHDFLLASFSSIIRKSSYADLRMAKTYKSRKVLKKVENGWIPTPIKYMEEALNKNSEKIKTTFKNDVGGCQVLTFVGDARDASLILNENKIGQIDLIITSPPYINAQDYFRSYKFELWWLGLVTPEEVRILKRKVIGSENVADFDPQKMPRSDNKLLNSIIEQIWKSKNQMNKKKAYIIWQYFEIMKTVFEQFHDSLRNSGVFCLVTGNNTICEVQIPTYKILTQIANCIGFTTLKNFRDEIRNRSLFPDRNHKGGVIKEEWITVFQKC